MSKYLPLPLSEEYKAEVVQKLNVSPEEACQIETFRRFIHETADTSEAPKVEKKDMDIKFDNVSVNISILRPLGHEEEILPVILFIHGGGWIYCGYDNYAVLLNKLVNLMPVCIVFVHYSLTPEVKYPVALEECYAALCWIEQNAQAIRVDAKRLAVGGDSAGGNLTAALTLYAKYKGNTGISQQFLYYPVVDSDCNTESFSIFKNDIHLSEEGVKHVWNIYVRKQEDLQSPFVSPFKATNDELKNLPPALVITAENDLLRDEGEAYARKLVQAGVPTLSVRYQNSEHAFISAAFPKLNQEAESAIHQTTHWLNGYWKRLH